MDLPRAGLAPAADVWRERSRGRRQELKTDAKQVAKCRLQGAGIVTSRRRDVRSRGPAAPPPAAEDARVDGLGGERAPGASLLLWFSASSPQSGGQLGVEPPAPGRPHPFGKRGKR